MDFNSNLDHLDIEELLKLLESTDKTVTHNDPFVSFLYTANIKKGDNVVKVQDIVRLYKELKSGKITVKKAIEVCVGYLDVIYIRAIPYFSVNKQIRTKKPPVISQLNKMKFEYFLEATNLGSGPYQVDKDVLYNYYDTWCYETRKYNQFSKYEFIRICGTYLTKHRNSFGLNRDIKDFLKQGDVAKWKEIKPDAEEEKT